MTKRTSTGGTMARLTEQATITPLRLRFEDFTRNIQRKKEKELADMQFVGGDGSLARRSSP